MVKKRVRLVVENEPEKSTTKELKLKTTVTAYSDLKSRATSLAKGRNEFHVMAAYKERVKDLLDDFELLQKSLKKFGIKSSLGPHLTAEERKQLKNFSEKDIPVFLKKGKQ